MTGIDWKEEVSGIEQRLGTGESLASIAGSYEVSRQRLYQVCTKFGLTTLTNKKANFLRELPSKYYWLNHMLTKKKIPKSERKFILETLNLPDVCPILGIPLNYDGHGEGPGQSRKDNSPSIDQILPGKGYVLGNMQVISWRANRIKNDATPEELRSIADYMLNLKSKRACN